jgi:hypothetical protein
LTFEFAGSDTCGHGLFSFGLATDTTCVTGILNSWKDWLALVRWHLILDYGLMVSYGGLLFLVGRSAARALHIARLDLLRWVALAGAAFGVAAALADAVENALLLQMVGNPAAYGLAPGATTAARIKFWLLIAALAALALSWAWIFFRRARIGGAPAAEQGRP